MGTWAVASLGNTGDLMEQSSGQQERSQAAATGHSGCTPLAHEVEANIRWCNVDACASVLLKSLKSKVRLFCPSIPIVHLPFTSLRTVTVGTVVIIMSHMLIHSPAQNCPTQAIGPAPA